MSFDGMRRVSFEDADRPERSTIDAQTSRAAERIVEDVRVRGEAAIRASAERFGERTADDRLVYGRTEMQDAFVQIDGDARATLERTAERIASFADAQRSSLGTLDVPIEGGRAGHTLVPVESAGCYAPAGRFPLPSSVLMTAVCARVAGCERVVVASPGANPIMLAAAAIAGVDEFLCVGGAHAIAAMAYGFGEFRSCDIVVGPGNKWVTAAKRAVFGRVGIDMLAGPSELLIIADANADPVLVAADMLAQAEHDPDASAMLVTMCETLARRVDAELARQLSTLATHLITEQALENGFTCVVNDISESIAVSDRIAPEHLEIMTDNSDEVALRVRHAGAVFIGARAAEVLGDYGAGPNHVLPTGGAARYSAGLSVMNFIRVRTWLRISATEPSNALLADAIRIARTEGLPGHAAAASKRSIKRGHSTETIGF